MRGKDGKAVFSDEMRQNGYFLLPLDVDVEFSNLSSGCDRGAVKNGSNGRSVPQKESGVGISKQRAERYPFSTFRWGLAKSDRYGRLAIRG